MAERGYESTVKDKTIQSQYKGFSVYAATGHKMKGLDEIQKKLDERGWETNTQGSTLQGILAKEGLHITIQNGEPGKGTVYLSGVENVNNLHYKFSEFKRDAIFTPVPPEEHFSLQIGRKVIEEIAYFKEASKRSQENQKSLEENYAAIKRRTIPQISEAA